MTKTRTEVLTVFDLADAGLSKKAISRETGISRAAIRDWLSDRERALKRTERFLSGKTAMDCHGACDPAAGLNGPVYAYLLGIYLGDGCISTHARAYRLRIACADTYPRIMDEVEQAIRQILPVKVGRVQCVGCTEVGAYSSHWPCFFPQHGKGMKHQRPIVLADWQRALVERYPRPFIKGLIQSDGWRGDNVAIRHTDLAIEYRTYTRYQFTNRSDDIRNLFCWALDLLDVHWTQSNKWTISVSRRKDVHYLDSFVGPKR